MVNQLYIFLPMIVLTGIVSSYTDIRYRKVSNRLIIVSVAYAILLNLLLAAYSLSTKSVQLYTLIDYYLNYLLNGIIALIASFFMWKSRIWNAGDSKLFSVFVFLLPLSEYSGSYIGIFPAAVLLINIFVPFALFFAGKLIFFSSFKTIKEVIRRVKKDFAAEITILVGISWGLSLLTKKISDIFGMLQNAAFTIILYFLVRKAISRRISYFRRRYAHLTPLFIVSALIILFSFLFLNISNRQLLIARLKSVIFLIFAYAVFSFFSLIGESKASIDYGKDASKRNHKVPFAPAIFIGALLTIVNKGFFYNIVLALFN